MFRKILRLLFAFALAFIMIIIVIINVKLYYKPHVLVVKGDTIQHELVKELRGLKHAIQQNADVEMQNIYPEGYVFLNAVYALTWSSFLHDEAHKTYFEEGRTEIHKAWMKINSPEGTAPFSDELPLPYGAFYTGWSSYVLASKLRLESPNMRNDQEVLHFKEECDRIAAVVQQITYPQSYYGAAWPADAVVCIASLSVHDQFFEPKYKDVIQKWITEVKNRLDVQGMIPHSVHPVTGRAIEKARGSSMALMLIFLHDIDFVFAQEQFLLFKKNFVEHNFGLTGIREYPIGTSGAGDIDSGPLIMGYGGAATIVGMQTLSLFGEDDLSLRVRNAIEAFSFPIQREDYKQYFFGYLPIADAFIAWSHSGMNDQQQSILFLVFNLFSLLVVALLSLLLWKLIP